MRHDISKNLLTILGLTLASEDEQDAALDRAADEALMGWFERIEARLTPVEREEMYRLFETDTSDEEKAAFFKMHAPDSADILMEEVVRVKERALTESVAGRAVDAETKKE